MIRLRKTAFVMFCISIMSILAACGVAQEKTEELGYEATGNATGTVLAGQDSPELTGILKSLENQDEVILTVDGQDVNYRLSEEAKNQIDGKEVAIGSQVTFTTFSIGDDKESIDVFIID